jgi:TRAP-type C4-dicarboxylate transport system substrate-binding protein
MKRVVVALALLAASRSFADQRIIRIGTLAPDGTSWARSVKTLTENVERGTHGRIQFKLYQGGVAGDEEKMAERIAKGQLDGVISAGMLCNKVSPSMAVLALPGLFQNRDEATEVMNRLLPQLQSEALASGYALLATSSMGPDVLYTRTPVRTFADLKKVRWWRWHLDDKGIAMVRDMGLTIVPTPVNDALHAAQQGKVDGYMAIPTAALAFQWATEMRYLVDLPVGFLSGCVLFSSRVFDMLAPDDRDVLRAGAATLGRQNDETSREIDAKLLGGLFEKQGLKTLPVSESLRSEYFAAARAARQRVGGKLLPQALIDRVSSILADYRAEHSPEGHASRSR